MAASVATIASAAMRRATLTPGTTIRRVRISSRSRSGSVAPSVRPTASRSSQTRSSERSEGVRSW